MKCNVLNCEYNNGQCTRLDEVIIGENGEGLYCNLYEEKESIKKSRFKLIETKFKDEDLLIVMSLSYRGLSILKKEILKEITKLYGTKYKRIIFDNTCSYGIKSEYRYHFLEITESNIVRPTIIVDEILLRTLKTITCDVLNKNSNIMENSILTSTQTKMILKGIVI